MSYLDATDYLGLGADAAATGAPITQTISRPTEQVQTRFRTTPLTRYGSTSEYTYNPEANSGAIAARPIGPSRVEAASFSARDALIASMGLAPSAPAPASPPIQSGSGYIIPSQVVAAPISPAIASIPGGGATEAFDYGAPTGAPSEEFDYGGPTGAPAEEYGDAAEAPASGGDVAPAPSGLPTAAVAALAGAAVGLGPLGVGLAAAAGFLFGRG